MARWRQGLWRLLALAGLLVGMGSLFRLLPHPESARGASGTPPSPESVAAGHEPKDIDARRTAMILGGMAAATALVIGIVFAMVWRFNVAQHAAPSRFVDVQPSRLVAPAPHLQRDPFADLARVRAREQELLHSYGWTSTDHSTARIPLDRAMALSIGKSLDEGP